MENVLNCNENKCHDEKRLMVENKLNFRNEKYNIFLFSYRVKMNALNSECIRIVRILE